MAKPLGEDLIQRKALIVSLTEQAGLPLGEAVRRVRNDLRLTVPEYAKIMRVAEHTIYAVEANKGNPSLNTANKLLTPLGFKLGVVLKKFPLTSIKLA
jgi:DNA-binding XRE family transcriptional regulator